VDAEQLAASCSRITEELPLCSVSSFHTIGEQLKIALSSSQEKGATAQLKCLGLPHATVNAANDRSMQSICDELSEQALVLSLEDYNQAGKPLFDRTISPVTRLLQDLTLRPDEIDEIVMVGGTTRMPQIRELVRGAFSTAQLNTHIDPDITVAYGAASVID
jgi:molecular chaperone DnaK (HSP70)